MDREEMLQAAIERKTDPIFMQSRSAVISYYQDAYGAAWKSHAAAAIAGTTDKKSRAYKSASRQFQMDKRTGQERYKSERVTPATKEKYQALGQELPPIGRSLRKNSITLTVKGDQKAGKRGGTRERTITVTFSGSEGQDFITSPTFRAIWRAYGVDEELFEEGDYAIDVSSVS